MAQTDREIGELVAEVRGLRTEVASIRSEMKEGFAEVDARLDAGDKRFRNLDIGEAESRGRRRVLLVVGGAALTTMSSMGALVMSYLPGWIVQIAEWMSRR